jgi:hypothetical protein
LICSGDLQVDAGSSSVDEAAREPVLITTSPNPFTKPIGSKISFTLHDPMTVALTIHDVAGRLVRTLLSPQEIRQGTHGMIWNGADANNQPVTGGVYFARLAAGNRIWSKRIILLR